MVLTISSPFISPNVTPVRKLLKFIFLLREDFVQLPIYMFACEFSVNKLDSVRHTFMSLAPLT